MAAKSLSAARDALSSIPEVDWMFIQQTEGFEDGAYTREFRVFIRMTDGRFCERSSEKVSNAIQAVAEELKITLPSGIL